MYNTDKISIKRWTFTLFFGIFLFVTLAPLLALSFFNHPSADDYTFANWTNFIDQQVSFYNEIDGRYIATFLLSLSPVHFHSFAGYKAADFMFILFFAYSLYSFIRKSFYSFIVPDALITGIVYIGVLFSMVDSASSLAEGFYWGGSVITYLFPLSLLFLLLVNLIGLFHEKEYKKSYWCSFLIFCVVGGNETLMFLLDVLMFCIFVYQLYRRHDKKLITISLALFLVTFAFSLFVALAPSNAVRMLHLSYNESSQDISNFTIYSIPGLLAAKVWLVLSRVLKNPFFLTYLTLAFYLINRSKTKVAAIRFLPCLFLTVLGISALLLPITITEKSGGPLRLFDTVSFIFIAVSPYLVYCLTKENAVLRKILIFIFFLSVFFFTRISPVQDGNYSLALSDLFSGKAARYDSFLNEQYEFLALDSHPYEIVPSIKNPPASIFFSDITFNPDCWVNVDYAKSWGKSGIKTRDD